MAVMSDHTQTADDFLAEYLESIGNLPAELSFNMSVLRDLDKKFHSIVESMRHNSRSYSAIMKQRRTAGTAEGGPLVIGADRDARGALIGYRNDYQMAVEQSNRKLDASQKVLDQFSTHFSRLERVLEKFEETEDPMQMSLTGSRKRKRVSSSDAPTRRRSRKSGELDDPRGAGSGTGGGGGSEDEGTYCVCQQVSYGSMVGCDNESCDIEWFHYACVGLTTQPKGAWFCSTCLAAGHGRGSAPPTPSPSIDDPIIDVEGDEEIKMEGGVHVKKECSASSRRRKKMEDRERSGV
ncbi:hypothetical protein DFJ77DRAFT_466116 [Powellomyces hirtus]|nr:hypothetical protein DFJ77DRAFT_466116 [Powellomyces hirtus]